jgi:multidrug efflux pump subunit AcrA (membrane-fusion protein)
MPARRATDHFAVGLCILGTIVGCAQAPPSKGPPPLAVTEGLVVRRDISTYASFNGQISPLYQATLSTVEAGTVESVGVTEGDFVSKGQLLASIDTSQLRAQLAANQATLRESNATLYKSGVQAPVNSQQYSSAVALAKQSLQGANNQVEASRSAVTSDLLVYHADQDLVAKGYVSESAFISARATYVAAEQTFVTDRQTVASAQAALTTAKENTQQRLGDQATIAQNRAALDNARANVDLLSAQIRQASIYAPFDGQVTQRLLDPGAYAGANTAILEISQTSTVYVVANVPDADLAAVARGKPITFETTSLPGRTFHGTIFDVNTTPTAGTLSYRVRILQPNPGLLLRPGMLVDETALSARHRNTLVVPIGAVFPTESGDQIYTIDAGKAKSIPVNLGLETGDLAEVSGSGVRVGVPVITSQPNGLQNGSPVTTATPQAAGGAPKPSAT